jgi:hypothetical protein
MLHKIIDKIKYLFVSKPKEVETQKISSTPTEEKYIGMLTFNLTDESDIDVRYALPDVDNIDIKRIPDLAEKYAYFLMSINDGYLRDNIIQIVEENLKKHQNSNEILFWENVITSWAMLHVEANAKKQKSRKDQPLIRPLSVFNNTGL